MVTGCRPRPVFVQPPPGPLRRTPTGDPQVNSPTVGEEASFDFGVLRVPTAPGTPDLAPALRRSRALRTAEAGPRIASGTDQRLDVRSQRRRPIGTRSDAKSATPRN